MKHTKLTLGLLLSVSLLNSVYADKPTTSDKNSDKKVTSAAKNDVNTVVDVQGTVASNDLNIRYIDLYGAMRDSQEGKDAGTKLELKRDELGQSLEGVRVKLETAGNEFKTKAATMNDQARAKKEQELVKMKRDYDNALQGAEEEMKLVMQQVTEALGKEVEIAVNNYAKKESVDAIQDIATGRVVYTSGKANCTNQIVEAMDKHFSYKLANNEKSAGSTVTLTSNKKSNAAESKTTA